MMKKKLIVAALGIVVLFGLALAQPVLAAKPVKEDQIVYLVTLEEGDLDTSHDCGTPGVGSNLGTLSFNLAVGCFRPASFDASDYTTVTLESGAFNIEVKRGEVVTISALFFVASDGTHWHAGKVPAVSSDFDGKKDPNGFTVTVDPTFNGGLIELTRSQRGKDKHTPLVMITIDLGDVVLRTHLEDGSHPVS